MPASTALPVRENELPWGLWLALLLLLLLLLQTENNTTNSELCALQKLGWRQLSAWLSHLRQRDQSIYNTLFISCLLAACAQAHAATFLQHAGGAV